MDFDLSERQRYWRDRVRAFMDAHIYHNLDDYKQQTALVGEARWKSVPQIIEDLKPKARAEGLWNLFMNPTERDTEEYRGAGLFFFVFALCAEEMGRVEWASEVFNCSAPDTGNMEVLRNYGSEENKARWLRPLMAGEIRSAFLMTEPAVASSDAPNIETSLGRDGGPHAAGARLRRRAARPCRGSARERPRAGRQHAAGRGPRRRDRPGSAWPGPHPPLHAHHWNRGSRHREDGPAPAEPRRFRQAGLQPLGLGAADRRGPFRHRA